MQRNTVKCRLNINKNEKRIILHYGIICVWSVAVLFCKTASGCHKYISICLIEFNRSGGRFEGHKLL